MFAIVGMFACCSACIFSVHVSGMFMRMYLRVCVCVFLCTCTCAPGLVAYVSVYSRVFQLVWPVLSSVLVRVYLCTHACVCMYVFMSRCVRVDVYLCMSVLRSVIILKHSHVHMHSNTQL